MQQREEQFAYEVISHALDRSVGRNRFLNTLFFILIAAQSAISAIIRDKIDEYPALDAALLAGFVFALGGAGLSLFVREGPGPDEFAAGFTADPRVARVRHIEDFLIKANRNARLATIKIIALALATALTIVPLVIAIAGRVAKV